MNAEKKQTCIFRLRGITSASPRLPRAQYQAALSHRRDVRKTVELVAKCGFLEDIYIRPLAYTSSQTLGVRLHNLEHDFLVFAFPWGPYLDKDKVQCGISSWHRPEDNVNPPQVKSAGIYINNALAKTEAIKNGFDEAIMMAPDGYVSEGSGENIFIVTGGRLVTPSIHNSILMGITRNTVIELARNVLGWRRRKRSVSRSELYFAGRVLPHRHGRPRGPRVSEIDHRPIGNGKIGPVTARLQELYTQVLRGNPPSICTGARRSKSASSI
jgi:branched-chain amino acid aminotransferase